MCREHGDPPLSRAVPARHAADRANPKVRGGLRTSGAWHLCRHPGMLAESLALLRTMDEGATEAALVAGPLQEFLVLVRVGQALSAPDVSWRATAKWPRRSRRFRRRSCGWLILPRRRNSQ